VQVWKKKKRGRRGWSWNAPHGHRSRANELLVVLWCTCACGEMMNFGEETESLVFSWFRFGGSCLFWGWA
jgi:hypothetical protein